MTWLPDIVLNLIQAISQSHDFNSPQTAITLRPSRPMLNIRHQIYACDLDLHIMSSRQLFGFSPTSSGAIWFGIMSLLQDLPIT